MGVEGLQRTKVGRYQLGDCLGHGSHTAVYRASTPSGASSALKLVDTRLQGSEDLAERLRREATVLQQLGHPGILPIWDPMASSEMTAAAMPLMVAPTLQDLMRDGSLDSDLAWSLLNQIADSLQSAHEWGLTYRVLKPVNILVRDGQAYLAEFGIAGRRAGRVALTTPDFYAAAPQYLAPEQVLGKEVDYRADIYAFAVLVFELATGTPLRDGAQPSAILQSTLNGPPPSAHERNPHIPRGVDVVLHRALAKDPEQRQASVWELINELADPPGSDRAEAEPAPLHRAEPEPAPPHRAEPEPAPLHRAEAEPDPFQPQQREPTAAVVTVESLIDLLSEVLASERSEGMPE